MFWRLFDGNPRVQDGTLVMGSRPGIGYDLVEDVAAELTLPAL